MFTNQNVISARYTNAENDTVEVLYGNDDTTRAYLFPARPTNSHQWAILKEAKWTASKVKDQTIEWIKDQKRLQYKAAFELAEELKQDAIVDIQKDYDAFVEKTNEDMRNKYDSAVSEMSASVRTGGIDTSLYDILKTPTDEQIFQLKVSILEDKEAFKGLTKTEEKTKRREIRKCMTIRELVQYL